MQFNKTQPAVDSCQGEDKLTGLEQGYSNLYRLPEKDLLPFALTLYPRPSGQTIWFVQGCSRGTPHRLPENPEAI